ncbi:hypothetical protein BDW66DRAFT_157402 [Aspergillus desertorum]
MKIVIIGGGISGCAAYLQLKKHLHHPNTSSQHEMIICEAYDTDVNTTHEDVEGQLYSPTLVVGGGFGLFLMVSVLKRFNEDILPDIIRGGYVIAHHKIKSKSGTLPLRTGKRMHMLGTSRHSLWSSLRRRIPDCNIQTKRVSRVVANDSGRNVVHFADGSLPVEVDLVMGADGVKGITKRALFPEQQICRPEYQGLVRVGGFVFASEVQGLVEKGSMNLVFGGNGFFGYFLSNSTSSALDNGSEYHVSEPGETLAWQLRESHADWRDRVIQNILPSLRVRNMLLAALEDAEAFAILLSHTLCGVYQEDFVNTVTYKEAISTAAKQYEAIRYPRVQAILENAKRMQNYKRNMGPIAECIMMYSEQDIAFSEEGD